MLIASDSVVRAGRLAVDGTDVRDLSERKWRELRGLWAAFEIYTPETTPLRRIAALGRSAEECMSALAARGLDPRQYEYIPLRSPLPF